jgi:ribosomal protein S18 acetylase RimI-like enzyme
LRRADATDLEALFALECRCFDPARRDTRTTLERGLSSRNDVWVFEEEGEIRAALFLRPGKEVLRIYSIATDPSSQGRGLGAALMAKAIERGRQGAFCSLSLEVDATAAPLLDWYERFGFVREELLSSFYGKGSDAWRLKLSLIHSVAE